MIKINFNEKRIFLAEQAMPFLAEKNLKNAHIIFSMNASKMLDFIDEIQVSDIKDVVIEGNPSEIMQLFRDQLIPIIAAGGLVVNPNNEILFIYRRKRWDLPKGKMDPGESIEECAIREVQEETGIGELKIVKPLLTTYHIYIENGIVFKTTYWYLMHAEHVILNPQLEEGITKAVWVHRNNIQLQLQKTYDSILDLFEEMK
jgi:8-oxo-dGTP pyrophosphatase MutT (NUDIX family)